jgi:hypothetical protein
MYLGSGGIIMQALFPLDLKIGRTCSITFLKVATGVGTTPPPQMVPTTALEWESSGSVELFIAHGTVAKDVKDKGCSALGFGLH